jgi:hypothetical protein
MVVRLTACVADRLDAAEGKIVTASLATVRISQEKLDHVRLTKLTETWHRRLRTARNFLDSVAFVAPGTAIWPTNLRPEDHFGNRDDYGKSARRQYSGDYRSPNDFASPIRTPICRHQVDAAARRRYAAGIASCKVELWATPMSARPCRVKRATASPVLEPGSPRAFAGRPAAADAATP